MIKPTPQARKLVESGTIGANPWHRVDGNANEEGGYQIKNSGRPLEQPESRSLVRVIEKGRVTEISLAYSATGQSA